MRRCMPLCLALLIMSACRGQDATKPDVTAPSSPLAMKFDGNDHGGNPDFFFLPPLARDPTGSPNYNPGASNVSLAPSVDICQLAVTGTTQAQMQANIGSSTPCNGAPVFSATLGAANVSHGILDDNDIDLLHFIATHYPSLTEPYYHIAWKVPTTATLGSSTLPTFYRVNVRVGNKSLGFLDVESVNNFAQLFNVNTGEFVPLTGGLRLPINFRIERYALCATPGVGPCTSQAVDLTTGGTVQTVLDPVHNPLPSGITIQPNSGTTTTTFTVESCPDLNPRAIDLPTFGQCVRVNATPALPAGAFAAPATVFNCNVTDVANTILPFVVDHAQADRITLHKLDETPTDGGVRQVVTALPHAPACGFTPIADAGGSLHGLLAELRRGHLKAAVREVGAMLAPKPAYAAMMIDLGGGGFTVDCCSDFQFALPAKAVIDQTTNNQLGPAGQLLPVTVKILDLGDEPVSGATVRFSTSDGTVSSPTFVTKPDGLARTGWTIGSGPANTLTAGGRGIAGTDFSGPREGVDPFQPLPITYSNGLIVLPPSIDVVTGSVTFSATTLLPPIDGFSFGSGGYRYLFIGSAAPDLGWEKTNYSPALTWATGSAPFGSVAQCSTAPPIGTNTWQLGSTTVQSDVLVRKTFSTSSAGSVQISVLIDNDFQLFVDGTAYTNGFVVHEGCADVSPPAPITISNLSAGNHVLAVQARDRGNVAFFDVSLSLPK